MISEQGSTETADPRPGITYRQVSLEDTMGGVHKLMIPFFSFFNIHSSFLFLSSTLFLSGETKKERLQFWFLPKE